MSALYRYFLGPYQQGHTWVSTGYKRLCDKAVEALVLEHAATGIRVWQFALDLRESSSSPDDWVLFHYTTPQGMLNICNMMHQATELLASVDEKSAHFGQGVYATVREPGAFSSQNDVLVNNYWPRCGDPSEGKKSAANLLKNGGGMGSGPRDPKNERVVKAIIKKRGENARYCIPIIVERAKVFNIWQCLPPDPALNGIKPGHNRWKEPQWKGRDVRVIWTAGRSVGAPVQRVVAICCVRVQLFPPEHSDRPFLLMDCGRALCAVGRASEAKPLLEAACNAFRRGDLAHTMALNNLAACLQQLGHADEAEEKYKQCYEASRESEGPRHAMTLTHLNNCAVALSSLGRLREAEEKHSQCYGNSWLTLGEEHPTTLKSVFNWAACLLKLGRAAEALEMNEYCYKAFKEAWGEKHPTTLVSLSSWASSLSAVGRKDEALLKHEQCYDLRKQTLGEKHPDTLESLKRICEGRYRVLGPSHPDTVNAFRSLLLGSR